MPRIAQLFARCLKLDAWRKYSIQHYLCSFKPSFTVNLNRYLTPHLFANHELIHFVRKLESDRPDNNELRSELTKLLKRSDRKQERLSVLDFDGVDCSKSIHQRSLRAIALYFWIGPHPLLQFTTDEDFAHNQKHFKENAQKGAPLKAQRQAWNGRVDMVLCDSSHHFAAILRQCLDQNRDAFFDCQLQSVSVDADTVDRMLRRWHLLITSYRTMMDLSSKLNRGENEPSKWHFCYPKQEKSYSVDFGHHHPGQRDTTPLSIYAIPRTWKHGNDVREALLTAGNGEYAFDLSDYLAQLVSGQQQEKKDRPQPKGEQPSTGYRKPVQR